MIHFNKPSFIEQELNYVQDAIQQGRTASGGPYNQYCNKALQKKLSSREAYLTHSCTAALEISALLINFQPGDEVIMPSYTFVSCATAFALRGATIKFADINAETLNLDPASIERQVTNRTKAIVIVHYAGVACAPEEMQAISKKHNLYLIEDAAHAFGAYYKHQPLGTFGDLATFSFHETKPIQSGEGGALLVNHTDFVERAEIIRDKGTNRSLFNQGKVAYYEWVDIGSSYAPSEITAAFLYGQLEHTETIIQKRLYLLTRYYESFQLLQSKGSIRLPVIPDYCTHNGAIFYIMCNNVEERNKLLTYLNDEGIKAVFHYFPLHQSTYYKTYYLNNVSLPVTENTSKTIIRLPLFYSLTEQEQNFIIKKVRDFFNI